MVFLFPDARTFYFLLSLHLVFLFAVYFLSSKVNTKSAEILYKTIQEWSNVSANTVILGE